MVKVKSMRTYMSKGTDSAGVTVTSNEVGAPSERYQELVTKEQLLPKHK